jgi:hypothetical protein
MQISVAQQAVPVLLELLDLAEEKYLLLLLAQEMV